MRQILKIFPMLAFVAILFSSCEEDGPYNSQSPLYDIVTFEGNGASGATFSFQRRDDSPVITLNAPGTSVSDTHKPQDRVILGYYPLSGKPYTSGEISVISVSQINQDKLHFLSAEELKGWNNDPVFLNSVWRSGRFINMYMRVEYSNDGRIFKLAADTATMNDSVPQIYLMHNMLDAPASFSRRAYISIDVASIWDKETCHGLTIHINDSNLKTSSYTFTK